MLFYTQVNWYPKYCYASIRNAFLIIMMMIISTLVRIFNDDCFWDTYIFHAQLREMGIIINS